MDLNQVEQVVEEKTQRTIVKTGKDTSTTSEGNNSGAMRSAVEKTTPNRTVNGKIRGKDKDVVKRMTPKMKIFCSLIAQGKAPKDAYRMSYNSRTNNDATILTEVNKLMKDPRVSLFLESVWETVKENIIDDALATRRKVMSDLFKHADNKEAQLSNRLKSLELIGRAIGMFTDKVETKVEEVNVDTLKRDLESSLHLLESMPKAKTH
jgi:hypothetical protein